jgi:hypothetical protein
MPKQYSHGDAARLAGEVFGKILDREADPAGYEYVLDCLEGGKKTLRQIVIEFISSDEFIERFVADCSPAETAALINRLLLGRDFVNAEELQEARRQLVRSGLRKYAESLAKSPEYQAQFTPNSVPAFGHSLPTV